MSPKGGYGNIAELQFFDEKNNLLNSFGKIIGTEGSWGNDPHRAKESAFDGDPLTFFDSSVADSAWVGLEFPEPVSVKKVIFLPRNDGNNVTIGKALAERLLRIIMSNLLMSLEMQYCGYIIIHKGMKSVFLHLMGKIHIGGNLFDLCSELNLI